MGLPKPSIYGSPVCITTQCKQMLRISSYGKTDAGIRRADNEDAFAVNLELGFCLVADGMGGEAAGEVASRIFAEAAGEIFSEAVPVSKLFKHIRRVFRRADTNSSEIKLTSINRSEEETLELVRKAFRLSNDRIQGYVRKNPDCEGMGCTAELTAFFKDGFVFGHVGDSRIYRFGKGELKLLTHDHSFVQKQIDQGLLTPEKARTHYYRNLILKAVGIEEDVLPDFGTVKARAGDLFLLCSDGLTDMVEDSRIQEVLSSSDTLVQKTEKLIGLSKLSGGYDNITVVLAEIKD